VEGKRGHFQYLIPSDMMHGTHYMTKKEKLEAKTKIQLRPK